MTSARIYKVGLRISAEIFRSKYVGHIPHQSMISPHMRNSRRLLYSNILTPSVRWSNWNSMMAACVVNVRMKVCSSRITNIPSQYGLTCVHVALLVVHQNGFSNSGRTFA